MSAFPDTKIEPIDAQTQFVILACDGIWDVKTSQQTIDFMMASLYKGTYSATRTLPEMEQSMTSLLDTCLANDIV